MSPAVQLINDGNHFRYEVFRGEDCVATLQGDRHALDTAMFILGWDGATQDADVRSALLSRLFDDCRASAAHILVHITPARTPIFEALVDAGFAVNFEKYLYRHNLESLLPPRDGLSLQPASTLPMTAYEQLFWECNQGDPLMFSRKEESAAAYLQHFIAEIADLHDPEQAHVAFLADYPIGILNLRVTHSHNITAGFMNYIGIHPDHRGQGLGIDLHRLGLLRLKDLHCDCYLGSTHAANLAMRAVFERNGAAYRTKQVFFRAL